MNLQDFLTHLSGQPGWAEAGQVTPLSRAGSGDTPLHAAIWIGDDEAARHLCGANTVAVASLAVLGSAAAAFATLNNLALETLRTFPFTLWTPSECPLCQAGVAVQKTASDVAAGPP